MQLNYFNDWIVLRERENTGGHNINKIIDYLFIVWEWLIKGWLIIRGIIITVPGEYSAVGFVMSGPSGSLNLHY